MNRKIFALLATLFVAGSSSQTSAEANFSPPGSKPDFVAPAPYPTSAPAPVAAATVAAPASDPTSAIRMVARLNSKLAAQNEQLANDFRKAEADRTDLAASYELANVQVAQLKKQNEALVDRNTALERSLLKKEGELAGAISQYRKIEAGVKSVLGVGVIIVLLCTLIAIAAIFVITRASKFSNGICGILERIPDETTAATIDRLQTERDFCKDVADRETRRVAVLRGYQKTDQAQIEILRAQIRTNAEAMANIRELERQLGQAVEKHRRASQHILDMKLYQEDTDSALAALQARLLRVLAEVDAMNGKGTAALNSKQLALPLAVSELGPAVPEEPAVSSLVLAGTGISEASRPRLTLPGMTLPLATVDHPDALPPDPEEAKSDVDAFEMAESTEPPKDPEADKNETYAG
jgi:hypothetical protein